MKLYITIMRSDADDLGLFEEDIDAQASVKLYDDLLIEEIENYFPEASDVEISFGPDTVAEVSGYGWNIKAPNIERWIENVANKLYKQPERWLVKKGSSIEV